MAKKRVSLSMADMAVNDAIEQLNKDFGAGTIIKASAALGTVVNFFRTGCDSLDLALGGGIPENRIIEIRGPFSSFKSTISLMAIKGFLEKYEDGLVFYIDLEKSFDPMYAKALGLDLNRIYLVNPDSGEQSADLLNKLLTLDKHILIILDSIAAMTPAAEVDTSTEQASIGVQARLVNRAMRVATARLKRGLYDAQQKTTTLIALNQLREKVGVMFGNPETTPGGKGKDFYYSVIIRMNATAGDSIREERTINKIKRSVRLAQLVTFKILKNKCGGPQYEEGEFTFYTKEHAGYQPFEIDNDLALFRLGAFHNIITYKDGKGFCYNGQSFKREFDMQSYIRKGTPSMRDGLFEEILDKIRADANPLLAASFKGTDDDEDEDEEPKAKKSFKIHKA